MLIRVIDVSIYFSLLAMNGGFLSSLAEVWSQKKTHLEISYKSKAKVAKNLCQLFVISHVVSATLGPLRSML